jgi:hypothetical protein
MKQTRSQRQVYLATFLVGCLFAADALSSGEGETADNLLRVWNVSDEVCACYRSAQPVNRVIYVHRTDRYALCSYMSSTMR